MRVDAESAALIPVPVQIDQAGREVESGEILLD